MEAKNISWSVLLKNLKKKLFQNKVEIYLDLIHTYLLDLG